MDSSPRRVDSLLVPFVPREEMKRRSLLLLELLMSSLLFVFVTQTDAALAVAQISTPNVGGGGASIGNNDDDDEASSGTIPKQAWSSDAVGCRSSLSLDLRVRSTRSNDLKDVASLLASSSAKSPSHDNKKASCPSWKTRMDLLHRTSALLQMLSSRHQAMTEGRRLLEAMRAVQQQDADVVLGNEQDDEDDPTIMRLLWSHDSFRRRLEKAAGLAKEPHAWSAAAVARNTKTPGSSSFDAVSCLQEADVNSLRHAMITAQDRTSGQIVGFCEVAMLAVLPTSAILMEEGSCKKYEYNYAPTIANLATCPFRRRQGIASALLQSAESYVHRKWSHNQLTLYVDSQNTGAVALYAKHGYNGVGVAEKQHGGGSSSSNREQRTTPTDISGGGELYMTKSIGPSSTREQLRSRNQSSNDTRAQSSGTVKPEF